MIGQTESDPDTRARLAALKQGLEELGWRDGFNVVFDFRYAGGKFDQLPVLAAELIATNVDVILAQGSLPVEAVRTATRTVPIVMVSVGDAVGSGFVVSLARPGGNITGLVLVSPELGPKRLELVKETLPTLGRAAVLWNAGNASHKLQLKEMEAAARALGLQIQSLPAHTVDDLEEALLGATRSGAEAIITMDDALIQVRRQQIVALATEKRLPVVGEFRLLALAGALLSYGPSQTHLWRRAASYVDKIFKGARPADLPVEQPTRFELIINLKTAKALGIRISSALLARADEVIE